MWNEGSSFPEPDGISPARVERQPVHRILCSAHGDVLFMDDVTAQTFREEMLRNDGEPWRSMVRGQGGLWHDQAGRLWDLELIANAGANPTYMIALRPALMPLTQENEGHQVDARLLVGLGHAAELLAVAKDEAQVGIVMNDVVRRWYQLSGAAMVAFHDGEWRVLAGQDSLVPDELLADALERQVTVMWEHEHADLVAVPVRTQGQRPVIFAATGRLDENRVEGLHALAAFAATILERIDLINEKQKYAESLQQANQEIIRAYDETVYGWTRAIDLRDKITEGHTMRVTDLTVRLAARFGFSERQITAIRRGALLHDIGKVGIPDRILMKEGALDDEEWEIMRSHTTLAHDMLKQIGFLQESIDIPHYHHERWDGKGYPVGLAGEDIPLPARMFAVVDVWDALTSDRPYRPAMAKEEARAIIEKGNGSHFDPQVVEQFLRMIDEEE